MNFKTCHVIYGQDQSCDGMCIIILSSHFEALYVICYSFYASLMQFDINPGISHQPCDFSHLITGAPLNACGPWWNHYDGPVKAVCFRIVSVRGLKHLFVEMVPCSVLIHAHFPPLLIDGKHFPSAQEHKDRLEGGGMREVQLTTALSRTNQWKHLHTRFWLGCEPGQMLLLQCCFRVNLTLTRIWYWSVHMLPDTKKQLFNPVLAHSMKVISDQHSK